VRVTEDDRREDEVDEATWLTASDPAPMLAFLQSTGRASERKLRLFACACCRQVWHLLPDERSRRAVVVAEALADGNASEAETQAAGDAAAEVTGDGVPAVPQPLGWRAARAADHLLPLPEESWQLNIAWEYVATALEGEQLIREGANPELLDAWSEKSVESGRPMGWTATNPSAVLAGNLRDIFGNPFAVAPRIDASVLRWNDGCVVRMAEGIYQGRAFERMGVLHDALLDAGCDNDEVLSHCRDQGEHVPGCWVLDLLLNKG
jgi:hypothetical protein